MFRSTAKTPLSALSFLCALSLLAFVQCGGDQKAPETPEAPMPSAEPPTGPSPELDGGSAMHPAVDGTKPEKGEPPATAKAPAAEALSDSQIAAVTDAANTAEIAQAKLAQSKSKDTAVKRFAQMMVTHHSAAKQKQAALKMKTQESSVSIALQADAESTLNRLKTAAGADFDRAYAAAQVDGHQKVLDAINDKLLPNAKDPDLRAYLEGIKPRVEQHLKEAKQLQENLDSKSSALTHAGNHPS